VPAVPMSDLLRIHDWNYVRTVATVRASACLADVGHLSLGWVFYLLLAQSATALSACPTHPPAQACSKIPDLPTAVGHLDGDTVISRHSYTAALKAAGAVVTAVDRVMAKKVGC
jgi:acetoin utilization deacetylase AcuC-like enzyme